MVCDSVTFLHPTHGSTPLAPASSAMQVFKSCDPVRLTEEDTEYTVFGIKHVYEGAIVVQFNCTNTISEQVLENVTVAMDLAEAVSATSGWHWHEHPVVPSFIGCIAISLLCSWHLYLARRQERARILACICLAPAMHSPCMCECLAPCFVPVTSRSSPFWAVQNMICSLRWARPAPSSMVRNRRTCATSALSR